jgi:protein arginine kinase
MNTDEAVECLSRVLLGLQMGYLSGVTPSAVCKIEQQIRPAVLGGTAAERDSKRAEMLRAFASQLKIV